MSFIPDSIYNSETVSAFQNALTSAVVGACSLVEALDINPSTAVTAGAVASAGLLAWGCKQYISTGCKSACEASQISSKEESKDDGEAGAVDGQGNDDAVDEKSSSAVLA